jgi:hypothetical protein
MGGPQAARESLIPSEAALPVSRVSRNTIVIEDKAKGKRREEQLAKRLTKEARQILVEHTPRSIAVMSRTVFVTRILTAAHRESAGHPLGKVGARRRRLASPLSACNRRSRDINSERTQSIQEQSGNEFPECVNSFLDVNAPGVSTTDSNEVFEFGGGRKEMSRCNADVGVSRLME